MITIQTVAAALQPRDEERRVLGRDTIAICGAVGGIFADLEIRLALARLSPEAKAAAIELVDAGCITVDASGRLWVQRLPTDSELKLLRQAIGLAHRRNP